MIQMKTQVLNLKTFKAQVPIGYLTFYLKPPIIINYSRTLILLKFYHLIINI